MRKIYVSVFTLLLFCFLLLGIASCKKNGFLGQTTTTNLNEATIFSDSANAEGFLANIYKNVGFAVSPSRFVYDPGGKNVPCGGLDAACDESETSHVFSTTALEFELGTINAITVTDDAYKTCYTQIRAVNQIFKNISQIPLKPANKTLMLAEARFLRAYYYFILLEHYGGVPIVGNTIYDYTQPIPAKRNTFDECVNYITSQCDSAGLSLPLLQTSVNYGRASKGACMALKARTLLYAASPLFNKPSSNTVKAPLDMANSDVKPLVGYTDYQLSRWATAEAAAYAVITSGGYSLFTDSTNLAGYGEIGAFQYLFTKRVNSEYIFQLMEPSSNVVLEALFQPPSRTGANGAYPYQGMVDAFPMANGKTIDDPTSGYDPQNPYAGRDPRLRYSITYDQSLMGIRTANGQIDGYGPVNIFLHPVEGVYVGGTDAVYQGTPTGYYNNKMLDPNAISGGFFNTTGRCLPIMRFSEMLLDYAEAANEAEGGPSSLCYQAINMVRQRAGIPALSGLSQDQMRTAIQNERRIELAYEGHRFFDVRRWLIADQTDNIQAQGMEVDRAGTAATYKIFPVRKHNFRTAMYLWPFPQAEIGKGSGLLQNPGY